MPLGTCLRSDRYYAVPCHAYYSVPRYLGRYQSLLSLDQPCCHAFTNTSSTHPVTQSPQRIRIRIRGQERSFPKIWGRRFSYIVVTISPPQPPTTRTTPPITSPPISLVSSLRYLPLSLLVFSLSPIHLSRLVASPNTSSCTPAPSPPPPHLSIKLRLSTSHLIQQSSHKSSLPHYLVLQLIPPCRMLYQVDPQICHSPPLPHINGRVPCPLS